MLDLASIAFLTSSRCTASPGFTFDALALALFFKFPHVSMTETGRGDHSSSRAGLLLFLQESRIQWRLRWRAIWVGPLKPHGIGWGQRSSVRRRWRGSRFALAEVAWLDGYLWLICGSA